MFGKKKVVQNPVVAKHMRSFFRGLPDGVEDDPAEAARAYALHLFSKRKRALVDEKRFTKSRFHVGLGTSDATLATMTMRSVLVSDTLLLSHHGGAPQKIGTIDKEINPTGGTRLTEYEPVNIGGLVQNDHEITYDTGSYSRGTEKTEDLLIECPNLSLLGGWILESEPLLKAGLAWYLPTYLTQEHRRHFDYENNDHRSYTSKPLLVPSLVDLLVENGRAVGESDTEPLKSRLVREILRIDLPFLQTIRLRDFSRITVEEFESYAGFRDFLRQSLIETDSAINAVQSELEIAKIGAQIADGVRSIKTQMEAAQRKRAIAVTGATLGTVTASLAAIYGPALEEVLKILGTAAGAGSIWGIIQAAAENDPKSLRQDKWHYVWILERSSRNS